MSNLEPRLTIGLPVYNGGEFLELALRSLLSQTFSEFELVISDNASTDHTEDICRAYAATDSRIRYYRNERNRGAIWNQNRVFDLARGELFKWAAHDDLCSPTFVERCVEALDRNPSVVLCYTETVMIDGHGQRTENYIDRARTNLDVPHERFKDVLCNYGLSNPMYGVIRSAVLRETGLLGGYIASDMVLLAELVLAGRFHKVPEHLFFRRDHPQKSYRANPTVEQLAAFYGLQDTKRGELVYCRLLSGYITSVRRAQLSAYQKLRCYAYLARWFRWKIGPIRNELTKRYMTSRRFEARVRF